MKIISNLPKKCKTKNSKRIHILFTQIQLTFLTNFKKYFKNESYIILLTIVNPTNLIIKKEYLKHFYPIYFFIFSLLTPSPEPIAKVQGKGFTHWPGLESSNGISPLDSAKEVVLPKKMSAGHTKQLMVRTCII